jgi:uncharacterized membrane-anchored protein
VSKRATLTAFAAATFVQVLILVGVPARKAITLATGKTAVLKVQPVDPYSLLSGYYVTLGFDISGLGAFPPVEGLEQGGQCYAVIEEGPDGIWRPVALERDFPNNLSENRLALLGRLTYGQIKYGIENFYIAETQRETIADDLRKNPDKARVEIRVDGAGNSALKRLIIEDRVYE